MNAKPLWGVGNKKNRFRADFQRPGTTPNLGLHFQDVENCRDIDFFGARYPNLTCLNFGQYYVSLPPKYGGQTPKIEPNIPKTVVLR